MINESRIYAESWNIAIRERKEILFDTTTQFNVIKNPFRYWIADPFLFEHGNEVYIFAEMYDYLRRRGVIGCAKITKGCVGKWKPVIIEPYHLSYPYIYEKQGEIFIVPESGSNRSLDVYRAVEFPHKWEKYTQLRRGRKLADTTLIESDGIQYGITYDVSDTQHYKVVLLDLEKNADICLEMSNIEKRRPAGKFFGIGDTLYRPAQNCVDGYGKGIVIYRVFENNQNQYDEEQLAEIFPENLAFSKNIFLDGMHTYNRCEKYEVIDIKTRRFNVLNLLSRIYGKIKEMSKKLFRGNSHENNY